MIYLFLVHHSHKMKIAHIAIVHWQDNIYTNRNIYTVKKNKTLKIKPNFHSPICQFKPHHCQRTTAEFLSKRPLRPVLYFLYLQVRKILLCSKKHKFHHQKAVPEALHGCLCTFQCYNFCCGHYVTRAATAHVLENQNLNCKVSSN